MTDDSNSAISRTLEQRIAEGYAEAWRPDAGQTIIGHVSEISMGETAYGQYPIVTVIRSDQSRASIHAFHSVLRDGMIDARPGIGEEIAVKYEGLRIPKEWDGKKVPAEGSKDDPRYHSYRVIVNRAPADVWGAMNKSEPRK
jgi:hypothetical protein